jgi:hypothetical protein
MIMQDKINFLNLIKSNIEQFGHHITVVNSDTVPRFAYTIGLTQTRGFELVFAGGIYFMKDQILEIINEIASSANKHKDVNEIKFAVKNYGYFGLSQVNNSWNKLLCLGVFDYYNIKEIKTYQIIPDSSHFTNEIPNMSFIYSNETQLTWHFLNKEWNYNVPKKSTVITNLQSMQGELITEVSRWEEDEWEMFTDSGSNVPQEEVRVVPIAVLLGIDPTLKAALNLKIGASIWRDGDEKKWIKWG